jgi:hypothetical protein
VTKSKKKKTASKPKTPKEEPIVNPDTNKTKKKKKTSAIKTTHATAESSVPTNHDDEDLESFLADAPRSVRKSGHEYEDV